MSLTNEDINAIRALLQESETRIYGNIGEHLQAIEAKMATIGERLQPIEAKMATIGERLQAIEAKMATLATRAELTDMETKLLTAFHQWASPAESRMRSNRVALREFDIVLESIEARLRKLEDNARPHQ